MSFFTGVMALNVPLAWANPWEELGPDQTLYQRVKKLEDYGLLDAQDKKVLDQGKYVTRLELAFYTEKAKARLSAPEFAVPTPTPEVSVPPPTSFPVFATPTVSAPSLVPALPTPVISDALKKEIDDLLKQLRDEAVYLRTQMALNDTRIQEQ